MSPWVHLHRTLTKSLTTPLNSMCSLFPIFEYSNLNIVLISPTCLYPWKPCAMQMSLCKSALEGNQLAESIKTEPREKNKQASFILVTCLVPFSTLSSFNGDINNFGSQRRNRAPSEEGADTSVIAICLIQRNTSASVHTFQCERKTSLNSSWLTAVVTDPRCNQN